MKVIGMHGRAACRLPQDLSGPGIAMRKSWLYYAALPAKVVMWPCGVKETETAFCGCSLLATKDDKQDRSPPRRCGMRVDADED